MNNIEKVFIGQINNVHPQVPDESVTFLLGFQLIYKFQNTCI